MFFQFFPFDPLKILNNNVSRLYICEESWKLVNVFIPSWKHSNFSVRTFLIKNELDKQQIALFITCFNAHKKSWCTILAQKLSRLTIQSFSRNCFNWVFFFFGGCTVLTEAEVLVGDLGTKLMAVWIWMVDFSVAISANNHS